MKMKRTQNLDTHTASIFSSAGRDSGTEEKFSRLLLRRDACVVITSAVAVAVDALLAFDLVGIENAFLDAHAHGAPSVSRGSIRYRHSFPVERKLVQDCERSSLMVVVSLFVVPVLALSAFHHLTVILSTSCAFDAEEVSYALFGARLFRAFDSLVDPVRKRTLRGFETGEARLLEPVFVRTLVLALGSFALSERLQLSLPRSLCLWIGHVPIAVPSPSSFTG